MEAFPRCRRTLAREPLTLAALAMAAFASACASLPAAPRQPQDDPAFTPPVAIRLPGIADDSPFPDVLLPGDVCSLRLVTQNVSEVNGLTLDGQGRIHLPLVGDVAVGGLSLVDAEKAIEEAVRRIDRFARAAITITDSAGHQAAVVGAVDRSGVVPLRASTRLADLVALAGGPKQFTMVDGTVMSSADLDGARLVREGKALPVSVRQALQGDPHHNVRVHPGDLLYVPPARAERVSVMGYVNSPKSMPFRDGIRLTEALAIAGGPNEKGDNGDVRIVRGPLSAPRVYRASIRALIDGKGHDVVLVPGDVVFVTEHWFASVGDVIARLAPLIAAGWLTRSFFQ